MSLNKCPTCGTVGAGNDKVNQQSETPETDAHIKITRCHADSDVSVAFARTLERELAEAMELIKMIAASVPSKQHYEYTTGLARAFFKRMKNAH